MEFTVKTQKSGKDADEDEGKWEWVGLVEWCFQTLADAAGGGLDVWGLEEGGDDDDALCSGGDDLGEGGGGDTTDAKCWDVLTYFALHGGNVLEADGGATGLGGGGEKRSEADVVEALGKGSAGLI